MISDAQWNYLRWLFRLERIVEPIARIVMVAAILNAAWQGLTSHWIRAAISFLVAAVLYVLLRWDPTLLKTFEFVDPDDDDQERP